MHRIRVLKSLILLLFIVILFSIQIFLLNDITVNYFIQLIILDLVIMMGIYAFRGFDNSTLKSLNSLVVAYSVGTILGVLFSLVIILFFPNKLDRLIFIITPLISALAFPVIIKFLVKSGIKHMNEKKYLVIGNEEEFKDMLSEVEAESMGRIKIYKYINPSASTLTNEITGERAFNNILIADPLLAETVNETLQKAKELGVSVEYLPHLIEESLKRIPLELIDKYKEYYKVIFSNIYISRRKRIYDILLASFGIIIVSPILLFLSIAISIESGFPIIFRQERVGLGRKRFKFKKFRSLRTLKQSELDKMEDPNETIEKRVTKIGKRIRKLRLDELPQFFNVIQGNMSLIGPRPEMQNYHDRCMEQIPYYELRYKMKPGITGWAQINYPHTSTMKDYKIKTEYDLYYVKNQNFRLDLEITLKTLETMLGMRGAE